MQILATDLIVVLVYTAGCIATFIYSGHLAA